MRLATWNVNSVRSRIDRVEALLQRHDIDVLCYVGFGLAMVILAVTITRGSLTAG